MDNGHVDMTVLVRAAFVAAVRERYQIGEGDFGADAIEIRKVADGQYSVIVRAADCAIDAVVMATVSWPDRLVYTDVEIGQYRERFGGWPVWRVHERGPCSPEVFPLETFVTFVLTPEV